MLFKSKHPDLEIPDSDLCSVVLTRAKELGDKPALVDGSTGRTLSYTQLTKQIQHFAAGLDQRDFKKGDVFATFIPNAPEYAVAFLGVAAVGGINTTVNSLYSTSDLIHQFTDSGARFLLTIPEFLDRALPCRQGNWHRRNLCPRRQQRHRRSYPHSPTYSIILAMRPPSLSTPKQI